MQRALLVEDDTGVRQLLARQLLRLGYASVMQAADGRAALGILGSKPLDIAVLDRALPHMSGDQVCRILRAQGSELPILIIGGDVDIVGAIRSGADDVLAKPFTLARFRERVRTLEARRKFSDILEVGSIRIDRRRGRVDVDGTAVPLDGIKLKLLSYLALRASQDVTRQELAKAVWGVPKDGSNTIAVHVSQLRAALGDSARAQLRTTTHGYRLDDPRHAGT
jgi:DNA-binding response OmpR family regulator